MSWVLFVSAWAGPALWATRQLDAFQRAHPLPGCGLPILAIHALAFIAAAVLLVAAAGAAWWSARAQRRPLSTARKLEVLALTVPGVLAVCAVLAAAIFIG